MQRRSAVGRLASVAAGLSLGKVPDLEAALPLEDGSFSVTRANLAASSGIVTCPSCQEMADSLELTPAGLCLRCADQHPALKVEPHSDTFWALSPREVRRLELEIERLSAKLGRMNQWFTALQQQQLAQGGDRYDRAMENGRDRWHALHRELHLLQMLRAASRQYTS
jgi:hypothetical protein